MLTLNPLSIEDLLKAHKLMMNDLVKKMVVLEMAVSVFLTEIN